MQAPSSRRAAAAVDFAAAAPPAERPGPRHRSRLVGVAFLALLVLLLIALSFTRHVRRGGRPVPAAVPWSETEPAALAAARRAAAERPDDTDARRRLAIADLGARRPFEAIWELVEAGAGNPDARHELLSANNYAVLVTTLVATQYRCPAAA